MKTFYFKAKVLCNVAVEAETEEEAFEKVAEIDLMSSSVEQNCEDWELVSS